MTDLIQREDKIKDLNRRSHIEYSKKSGLRTEARIKFRVCLHANGRSGDAQPFRLQAQTGIEIQEQDGGLHLLKRGDPKLELWGNVAPEADGCSAVGIDLRVICGVQRVHETRGRDDHSMGGT